MSTLKADTIVASDGTSPVTLTKQSAAKAYVLFDGDDATPASRDSLNHSSITDNSAGDYSLTKINAMSSASYGMLTTGGRDTDTYNSGGEMTIVGTPTSTVVEINSYRNRSTNSEEKNDVPNITFLAVGDLA